MFERVQYVCENCYTAFYDREAALKCEKSHDKPESILDFEYKEAMRYPVKLSVKTTTGKIVEYEEV